VQSVSRPGNASEITIERYGDSRMLKTSIVCIFASYGCAFICELAQLKWRRTLTRVASLLFGAAGLMAHTFYLLNRSFKSDLPPLLSSAHDWLLVLAYIVVVVFLFVSMADPELAVGLVIWPVVLALVIASQFVLKSPSTLSPPTTHRGWIMLHASVLVLGIGGVLQGFVLSLLYLWQHRRLKHRQMTDASFKLPNLELIQRLNRLSIFAAVPLLTIGVISGVGVAAVETKSGLKIAWTDPIVIGGAVTWTLMGVLLVWLLTQKRSPGRQVALLTAWSCGFLIVTLIGLQVLAAAMGIRGVH
jgi:ABC-type transport system involved in cytochrome c biogenesis permease subunit